MNGFELRLWRRGMMWSMDRAAEELGVSLRTYKDYENSQNIKRSVALATVTLSLREQLSHHARNQTSGEDLRFMISAMIADTLRSS